MLDGDDQHLDKEWVDQKARCEVCGGRVIIRARRFVIAMDAIYVSGRCAEVPTHELSTATYKLLAELRDQGVDLVSPIEA